jgi:rRNA maturation endonuclease Nob1
MSDWTIECPDCDRLNDKYENEKCIYCGCEL